MTDLCNTLGCFNDPVEDGLCHECLDATPADGSEAKNDGSEPATPDTAPHVTEADVSLDNPPEIETGVSPDMGGFDSWMPWADWDRKQPNAQGYSDHDEPLSYSTPANWTDLETAQKWSDMNPELAGHGFVLQREGDAYADEADPYYVIDFDDARDTESGRMHPVAIELIERAGSYADVSDSWGGGHAIAAGSLPDGVKSIDAELPHDDEFPGASIEVYDGKRFVAMTGRHIVGTPEEPREAQDLLDELADEYATVPEAKPDAMVAEPAKTRTEIADVETTSDQQDIYDAVEHTYPRDIQLRSPVTEERGDGSKSLDPSWEDSDSGARLAQVGDGWVYRKGMRGLDALQVVALEERIIHNIDEYPSGDEFVEAVDALRERGAHIPEYEANDGPDVSAAAEARDESAETDGGTVAESNDEEPGLDLTLEERIQAEVILPLDNPDSYDGETIDQKVAVDRAAEIVDDEMSFVRPRESTRGWRDSLYVYVDGDRLGRASEAGIFEPNAKAELERMGERLFGPIANDAFVREFTNKVERRNRVRARTLQPAEERLVVNNGIVDLTTGELEPHTPDEYHRAKVEHDYDPDAECPRIDEFLHSVVDDDDVGTLYRFVAHALYKGYPEAKAAMLLGDGANGKSVFLSLVERFLGEFNVSGRSLQDITEYRWAANDLVGKMANVHADMSDQDVDSMRMFKQLTGEDTVDADVKFEKPVKFTNHATMLFACNDMPVLKDDTQGNWRRWVLINFPNTFDDDDPAAQDAIARSQLEDELFDEAELEGLLARCVEEIGEWYDGRAWFPDVPDWRATRSKMRRAAEPVFDFAEACLVNDDETTVEKSDVREAYRQYATREGLPKMEREEFGRKLHMLADYNVEAGQKRADDGPGMIQVYKGVDLNRRGERLAGNEETADPREATMKTVRGEDGRIPEALVIERLHEDYGIDNGRAEHALEKLKGDGTLMLSKEHGVEWVEIV